MFPFFLILDLTSKPTESLEQIATFDVEKLLSKSATLSENLLLQLRQSLTKEWGTGSVVTLPKDFHSETPNRGIVYFRTTIFHSIFMQLYYVPILLLYSKFLHFHSFLLIVLILGFNIDRISDPFGRKHC